MLQPQLVFLSSPWWQKRCLPSCPELSHTRYTHCNEQGGFGPFLGPSLGTPRKYSCFFPPHSLSLCDSDGLQLIFMKFLIEASKVFESNQYWPINRYNSCTFCWCTASIADVCCNALLIFCRCTFWLSDVWCTAFHLLLLPWKERIGRRKQENKLCIRWQLTWYDCCYFL